MLKKVIGIAFAVLAFAALVPGLNAQTRDTLLRENFNGEWSTTTPPAGWSIVYDGSVTRDDWGKWGYIKANCAELYWDYETGVDRLITPSLDCSNPSYSSVWLSLYHEFNYWGNGYTAQIRGSNNGDTYDYIIYDYNESTIPPTNAEFDISTLALGQSNVTIDWYGNGYTYDINWWDVDSVLVYAVTGGGGPTGVDFQMAQILRPKDQEEGGVAFTPTCKVYLTAPQKQNYAADPTWPADVRCRLTDLSNMQVVYDKVLSNVPFPLGYTTVDAFPAFTPEGGKKYKALFVVTGVGDIDASNDNIEKNWKTMTGEDVTPTEIIAPADNQVNKFAPSVKFLEKAGVDEAAVVLHYRIEDATYHALVSEDSTTHDFAANEEYTATFPEVSNLTGTSADYSVTFWATNAKGSPISHPELSRPFVYSGITEKPEAPRFALSASSNVVNYSLAEATTVSLKVYDAAGNLVSTLASGAMTAGSHSVTFAAKSGIYFVKLVTPEYSAVRKVTVIK